MNNLASPILPQNMRLNYTTSSITKDSTTLDLTALPKKEGTLPPSRTDRITAMDSIPLVILAEHSPETSWGLLSSCLAVGGAYEVSPLG